MRVEYFVNNLRREMFSRSAVLGAAVALFMKFESVAGGRFGFFFVLVRRSGVRIFCDEKITQKKISTLNGFKNSFRLRCCAVMCMRLGS